MTSNGQIENIFNIRMSPITHKISSITLKTLIEDHKSGFLRII